MKRASSRSRSLTLRLSACSDGTKYRTEYRAVLFSYGQLVPDRPIAPPGPVREGKVGGSGIGPRPFPRSDAKVSVQSTEYRTKGLHFGHFPLSACMSKTVEGRGGGAPASPSLIAIGQPALPTTWKPCLPVMWPTFCAPLPVRWNVNRLPLGKTCSY